MCMDGCPGCVLDCAAQYAVSEGDRLTLPEFSLFVKVSAVYELLDSYHVMCVL